MGVLVGNFEKTPQEVSRSCFLWAWLEVFSPLRGTNSKTINYLLSYFFVAQYPKRYHKSSWCGPFKAEHPKRYQNRFYPLRYDEHPVLFIWEFPWGGITPGNLLDCYPHLIKFYDKSNNLITLFTQKMSFLSLGRTLTFTPSLAPSLLPSIYSCF